MIGAVDLFLHRLVRWSIGPLTIAQLPPRESAHLAKGELASLRDMAESKKSPRSSYRPARPTSTRRPPPSRQ